MTTKNRITYDAEWIHVRCREGWGVESVIPSVQQRRDGSIGGKWRSQMSPEYLQQTGFGRHWVVETFFSAMKRTLGSTLNARQPQQMLAEAAIRVLTYSIHR